MNKIPQEIERKYLIREDSLEYPTKALYRLYSSTESLKEKVLVNGETIQQGYMPIEKGIQLASRLGIKVDFEVKEARLRFRAGKSHFTLKGEGDVSRREIEHRITKDLFDEYWPSTDGKRVEKTRLKSPFEEYVLEIDVYTDRDLIIAEVEVPTITHAENLDPIGLDVTANKRYKNKNLAK